MVISFIILKVDELSNKELYQSSITTKGENMSDQITEAYDLAYIDQGQSRLFISRKELIFFYKPI